MGLRIFFTGMFENTFFTFHIQVVPNTTFFPSVEYKIVYLLLANLKESLKLIEKSWLKMTYH